MEKVKNLFEKVSHVLELIMAVLVLAGVAVGVIHLWNPFMELVHSNGSPEVFLEYIADVLEIVVGIEFFRMLCKPDASAVLEVVMFVIARHMIVHETTAVENLLGVVSIAIVVVLDIYLHQQSKHTNDGEKALTSEHS